MKLSDWVKENYPGKNFYWYDAAIDQFTFVDTTLRYIMTENKEQGIEVVGHHTSKSIKLPVYHFKNSKFELWFRNNFHDWSITAHCQHPVDYEFCGILLKEDPGRGCCFEGMDNFREKWYYPSFQMTKFSTVVHDNYEMYLFIRTLRHAFGVKYA